MRAVPSGASRPASDAEGLIASEYLARLQRSDHQALDALLEQYWSPLVSYASHLLEGNEDVAEDMVQEAFVRLWERRKTWKAGTAPANLLYTIVRNCCRNEARNRSTRRLLLGLLPALRATETTPEKEFEGEEVRLAAKRAIEALPRRRREIFVLVRFHGRSYHEVAEIMSITPRTVANQMSSALRELRENLDPFIAVTR